MILMIMPNVTMLFISYFWIEDKIEKVLCAIRRKTDPTGTKKKKKKKKKKREKDQSGQKGPC